MREVAVLGVAMTKFGNSEKTNLVLASVGESGCYEGIEIHRFPWQRSFRADEYVRLIRTYSDHATLPQEVREPLLRDIAKAIDDAGGTVQRSYEAVLLLARPAK